MGQHLSRNPDVWSYQASIGRLPKCIWSRVQRHKPRREAGTTQGEVRPHLGSICTVRRAAHVGVPGHHPRRLGGVPLEEGLVVPQRAAQAEGEGSSLDSVPSRTWAAGTRHWTSDELSTLHKMQTRMTRRICHMWPFPDEDWPAYMRRTCRWAEELWTAAGIPRCGEAIAASWWRWSGDTARYRWSIKAVQSSRDAEGPQRLGRGHRTMGKRRWDDPTQSTELAAGHELLWHEVAQDGQTWKQLGAQFVRRVTRTQRDTHEPAG